MVVYIVIFVLIVVVLLVSIAIDMKHRSEYGDVTCETRDYLRGKHDAYLEMKQYVETLYGIPGHDWFDYTYKNICDNEDALSKKL